VGRRSQDPAEDKKAHNLSPGDALGDYVAETKIGRTRVIIPARPINLDVL